MSMNDGEVHLLPLIDNNDFDNSSSESEDDDSIEVVSNVDEEENKIIDMTKYLTFSSDDESEIDDNANDITLLDNHIIHCSNINDRTRSSAPDGTCLDSGSDVSDDDVNEHHPSNECATNSTSYSLPVVTDVSGSKNDTKKTSKRKRRQWSIVEKLNAINTFKSNGSKHRTAVEHGCTTAQLRKWLNCENELLNIVKSRKRRRLGGAGKKLKYIDLDLKLLVWFRERRGKIDSNSTTCNNNLNIPREKVTLKQLRRQGVKLSVELNHEPPSCKWYYRFLSRHRLSLQRPKRQQKIPLTDAYKHVTSFYSYIRRANKWGPKRGPMGAFTPRDICNMDESPLELFGDQSKRSINDIGTSNDIEGHLTNKRFATLILTVFAEDNSRVGPILLFKGQGRVAATEKGQYAQGVHVFFTPKGVINGTTMDRYVQLWWSKVKDPHPKLMIADSANSHLNADVIRDLRKKRVVVAIIPKGCTMYVQVLDVSVFSVFKNHYDDVVEEYIDHNGPRSKIKLTASQSRILCTRFTWSAWLRTLKTIDFRKAFRDIGYVWSDDSPFSLRTMPGYTFDPSSADWVSSMNDENDTEDRIDIVADKASEQQQHTQSLATRSKQLTLFNMWKK
ncbi:unnamed protein product [Rotaria sordida]|uniref:DDE-1 domain-containing protein n=1 Tax=Rotaria sordida TaxID=392033 RepID=A0A814X5E4_9BILA|nr:unnamed protein product [Rotaria sordida]CAF3791410.1 unnamed protein product [Rotaria sordida]